MKKLEKFVSAIRKTLENDSVKKSYIGFNNFPSGSCKDASLLLGTLLKESGYEGYLLISAWNDEDVSHSWLENNIYIIDITADQFETWPHQPNILKKEPLPKHYQQFHLDRTEHLVDSIKVPDAGYYKAVTLSKNIIRDTFL